MRFCDLIDAVRRQPEVTIPAEWGQGRASFGGLVAALQFEVMRTKVPTDRPVRSLAITFVGPVEPEVPVSFEVEVLRASGFQDLKQAALSFSSTRSALISALAMVACQVATPVSYTHLTLPTIYSV